MDKILVPSPKDYPFVVSDSDPTAASPVPFDLSKFTLLAIKNAPKETCIKMFADANEKLKGRGQHFELRNAEDNGVTPAATAATAEEMYDFYSRSLAFAEAKPEDREVIEGIEERNAEKCAACPVNAVCPDAVKPAEATAPAPEPDAEPKPKRGKKK